ncbi:hypothetical protein MINS_26590 [Mycolicibacterium insubricum]|nr:hypothetical protein MINS_26590 [Mycolicibacterium insubricum]
MGEIAARYGMPSEWPVASSPAIWVTTATARSGASRPDCVKTVRNVVPPAASTTFTAYSARKYPYLPGCHPNLRAFVETCCGSKDLDMRPERVTDRWCPGARRAYRPGSSLVKT